MIVGLIPSRLNSKRLFQKPLIKIDGLPIIVHTMRRAMLSKFLDDIYVCTDSLKIAKIVKQYGGKYILTSTKHKNGTERIGEALKKIKRKIKLIVDIQGDEPTINPNDIDRIIKYHLNNLKYDLVIPHIYVDYVENKNQVKIISNNKGKILYLTRAIAPFNFSLKKMKLKKHLSVISFKKSSLEKYNNFKESYLEKIEGVELLRALENGQNLGTFKLNGNAFAVDVKKDIKRVRNFFKRDKIRKFY
jgi:3-deoxy-manno-octulosonate cytidylyltransferase (CMP-KDO synthetase)